ncbi:MAG: Putative helicase [uncultured Sulfurovum sp.]|uniref:Helicase n=1 Tax=uncultured Sulfurovum sp. TaxID=269237 RepID=A0A6S6TPX5_9BACT|nr:MAG: Putative helicase [uncultured Sulfurovum sp.]
MSSDVDLVLQHLKENNVFLTGGAGVGKSYTTTEIIRLYRSQTDEQIVALGSTGVSAVNIGGFTIHSFFVFGISNNFEELDQNDKRSRSRLSELKKILKATDLIIIDEISMVSSNMMEMISYRLSSMGYLGKLLFVGDFFQLPPVQKFGQNSNDLFGQKLYAFESDAWKSFTPIVIELTEMKRTSDAEFTHILHKVRVGQCDQEVMNYMMRLSNSQIIDENPTMLFGRNAEVNSTNKERLSAIEAEEHLLFATFEEHQGRVHEKHLASWKNMLPIEEQLTLKVGVPVLFTINKWGKYANGERGIVHKIEEDYIIIEKEEIYVRVERHDFDLLEMKSDDKGKVESIKVATLSQFPLKLAYAVTIHKSQGMSIDNLICNVDNIFAPSQFYVAISRAINPKNLRLDFNRGNLMGYLQNMIKVDMRVVEYYTQLGQSYVTNEELPF